MDVNNLRYCKRCGRLFNYKISLMCPECVARTDEDFITCREYIDKNKNVTISELAKNTEVDEKVILYLVKEGRLNIEGSRGGSYCEKCGTSIPSGRYCLRCKDKMIDELSTVKNDFSKAGKESKKKYDNNSRGKMFTATRFANEDEEKK